MLAIVLSDNIADGDFQGEWGLSIYIEYNGKNFLLDTGASNLFVQNANKLGKSIKAVDYAILSHAHYDHSDSMATFFNLNNHAPFFLRKGCKENCYSKKRIFHKYIGLPKHILTDFHDRITYVEDTGSLSDSSQNPQSQIDWQARTYVPPGTSSMDI